MSSIESAPANTIKYTDAIFDEDTRQWVSRAEVAEVDSTAFASMKAADHALAAWW